MTGFDELIGKKSPDLNIGNDNSIVSKNEVELSTDIDSDKCLAEQTYDVQAKIKEENASHNKNRKSKGPKTLDLIDILKNNIIELFVDQIGEAYAAIRINDHIESISVNSIKFREWIIKAHYNFEKHMRDSDLENTKPNSILANEEAAKIQTIIKLEAEEQQIERRLEIRVAGNVDSDADANEDSNIIYYDLCNRDGEIIKVTKNGWEIIKHGCQAETNSDATIVFKHYRNQLPQVMPNRGYEANVFAQFLSLTNLPADDVENRILAEVYIISLFFPPDISKPILIPHGQQGSAKSTFQEFIKDLVDPSGALTLAFPKSVAEIVQQLSHNYVAYYDNVSSLPQWISDVLCRAVTGSGFSKRMLYTDDDDFIYKFKRCVGFNGINIAATKPDLLERALILELKRISDDKRRKLKQLWKQYGMIKPQLLGFIFDIIVKVLNRLKEVHLTELPRMADWAEFGEVISRCLGHPEGAFLRAYSKNLAAQNEHALEASQISTAIIKLMEKRMSEGSSLSECIGGIGYFKGSMTDLLKILKEIADCELGIDTKDKRNWPQSPQALGNKLTEATTNLREIGILIQRPENRASHTKDVILIKQNVSVGEPGNKPLESFPYSSPSENTQFHAQIEHKRETGELGDFAVSVGGKNENEMGSSCTLGVPASSPTFPSSRSDENHAQIASDINGKLDGEVEARANSCSPLRDISSVDMEHEAVELNSITDFFYEDPNRPYAHLPEHDLDRSPCYPIISIKQGYFYCRLHPDVKYVHLESIEHHIKYKDPEAHKSELLKSPKLTHG